MSSIFLSYVEASGGPLKVGYYRKACPSAESMVRNAVSAAYASDTGVAAALIRLHFHDCFVRGCDASVLLDSKPGRPAEKASPMNSGLAGFDVIDAAKAEIESRCPSTVSCADILAFAARDAVFKAGGIRYNVPAGRRDGRVSLEEEAAWNLPDAYSNLTQLRDNFARKGLSLQEMVVLSGAHSIGDAHCSAFSRRLYSFNATHATDPSLDWAYADYLKTKCPRQGSDPVVPFDPVTPVQLDNNYYRNLKAHKGLLASDQTLWSSVLTRKMVKGHVDHPSAWASRFAAAMVRMGSIEVLVGRDGEIRKKCRVLNY
ncbi:Peroxidase [Bertholletia excelsa]